MSVDTTLQKLINIDSVTGDEILILDFIEEFLSKNNFSGEIIRNDGGIIAIPKNSSQKIALVGHVDTVPVSKTQKIEFDDTDTIPGRGSVDMKGGISLILHSLVEENQDIVGVFYTAEEGPYEKNGLGELMPIILGNKNLEFSIILEPTNCQIELGCLGTLNANIKLKGLAAHSARPWVGDNPIYKIGDISKKVSENEITLLDIEGLEFKQVLSITTVSSGIANNVIPDEALLNINFRFSPEMSNDDAHNFINNMFSEFGEIEITSSSEGAMPNLDNPNVKNFITSTGLSPNPKQAWTDIARFYSHGIPSVNFGPGDPLLAHTADEHVSKKQLLESYELLMNYLRGSTVSEKFDISNIAKLASISLSDDEKQKLSSDLSVILEHVQALSNLELDTNIEDVYIHPLEKELVLDEDIEKPSLTHDEALSNAPKASDGKFIVPPSLE